MGDISYIDKIEKLAKHMNIGKVLIVPKPVSGGLLHKMYLVETTAGKYAVKALNPQIMKRPNVIRNYINSERIAKKLSEIVPALPALQINNNPVQYIDGQYFMVFEWLDGISLSQDEITSDHCRIMGNILASIHTADLTDLDITENVFTGGKQIDWNYYLDIGRKQSAPWAEVFNRNIKELYDWNLKSMKADMALHKDMVLSHRDMDSKNVLWNKEKPVLIDWESAGYVNPMKELIEVLMYWSGTGNNKVDEDRFKALLSGYKEKKEIHEANWSEALNSGYCGKLNWLEYSLKRSLKIECSDKQEQQLGTQQAFSTISELLNYTALIPTLKELLNAL